MSFELRGNEKILADVPANLFRVIESVGGNLKITNLRLFFQPHILNIQSHPEEIPIDKITGVEKINSLWIVPNGMLIKLKGGEKRHFVVWGRDNLIKIINENKTIGGMSKR